MVINIELINVYDRPYTIEVGVNVTTFGRHIPATRFQPEEYPEIEWEIYQVWLNDKIVKRISPENWVRIETEVEKAIDDMDAEDLY